MIKPCIQIQLLLKLNGKLGLGANAYMNYSNTTLVKVKLINLISEGLLRKEFKYNSC